MASLTITAYYSRKIIKWGSIGLVAFMILRGIALAGIAAWKKAHPPPPPPPTVEFGKLPRLVFPERPSYSQLKYKLETISGTLPTFPDRTKVYFLPKSAANYLAWERVKSWAKALGFTQEPEQVDQYNLRFSTTTFPTSILDVNVLSRDFHLTYDWKNDPAILGKGNLGESQTVSLVRGYLQTANALEPDLQNSKTTTEFYKYVAGELKPVMFVTDANFIKVNIFRDDVDKLKVVPENPKQANIWALVSPDGNKNKGIVDLKYSYSRLSGTRSATYPIKTADKAWAEAVAGKAYVANLGNNQPDGQVVIRNVYLVYYDTERPQNFMQTVFVFEGDRDFFAFVPAITDSWME